MQIKYSIYSIFLLLLCGFTWKDDKLSELIQKKAVCDDLRYRLDYYKISYERAMQTEPKVRLMILDCQKENFWEEVPKTLKPPRRK